MTAPSPAPTPAALVGRAALGRWWGSEGPSILRAARAAITANAAVSTAPGRRAARVPAAIAGTIPAAANSAPVFQRTLPEVAWV